MAVHGAGMSITNPVRKQLAASSKRVGAVRKSAYYYSSTPAGND